MSTMLMGNRDVSRLRVTGISPMTVVAGAFALTAISAILSALLGANADRMLGISGAVLGVTTFGLSQWQTKGPRARRVVMVPKSRSPFSASVHRGLADALHEYSGISMSVEWPAAPVPDEVAWQLRVLRSPNVIRADGVVIVPAADDERLWLELVRFSRAGGFVVVLDTKPTNAFFAGRSAPRPCFVGSDFSAGGDLVGIELVDRLSADPDLRAVVALGPVWSFPGSERSRAIAHWISLNGARERVFFLELKTWDKIVAAKAIGEAVMEQLRYDSAGKVSKVVAFCGNDKILASVDQVLRRLLSADHCDRVSLIGYDGAVGTDGSLMAGEYLRAVATIDTQPTEQGVVAAELLIDEHRGLLAGRASRYIAPRIVRFGS